MPCARRWFLLQMCTLGMRKSRAQPAASRLPSGGWRRAQLTAPACPHAWVTGLVWQVATTPAAEKVPVAPWSPCPAPFPAPDQVRCRTSWGSKGFSGHHHLHKALEVGKSTSFSSPSAISSRASKINTGILGLLFIPTQDGSFIIPSIVLSNPTKQELAVIQPGHD